MMSFGYASQDGTLAAEDALLPFFTLFICIPVVDFGLKVVCSQLKL